MIKTALAALAFMAIPLEFASAGGLGAMIVEHVTEEQEAAKAKPDAPVLDRTQKLQEFQATISALETSMTGEPPVPHTLVIIHIDTWGAPANMMPLEVATLEACETAAKSYAKTLKRFRLLCTNHHTGVTTDALTGEIFD